MANINTSYFKNNDGHAPWMPVCAGQWSDIANSSTAAIAAAGSVAIGVGGLDWKLLGNNVLE